MIGGIFYISLFFNKVFIVLFHNFHTFPDREKISNLESGNRMIVPLGCVGKDCTYTQFFILIIEKTANEEYHVSVV